MQAKGYIAQIEDLQRQQAALSERISQVKEQMAGDAEICPLTVGEVVVNDFSENWVAFKGRKVQITGITVRKYCQNWQWVFRGTVLKVDGELSKNEVAMTVDIKQ